MIAVALWALLAQQDWQPRPGTGGFVNPDTLEQKTPDELLKFALVRREAGDFAGALGALYPLVQALPEGSLRETAHFERAETLFRAARYYDAYDDYEKFILRYPQSTRAARAKEREMEAALNLARAGHKETVLGVPLVSSSRTGIDYLKDTLRRYPREDFSAGYYQKLGKFYYEQRDWDHASEQFTIVLEQYADSPDSVFALYMLGLTNESRFQSVDYDAKTLRDARRFYERFLEEADRMRKLPPPAKDWVDGLFGAVAERLAVVYQHLLEKTGRTARYYDWKDLPWSAAIYYRSILKDDATFRKVLPRFPETDVVRRAKRRLPEIQAELEAEIEENRASLRK
ncbi:MAG TPA: outer membrane protein assembly factor BamD [Planctomycetota bacterium]|nr:outer membrane protein assembly factor BamD [Planctomycetota bacterium]